MRDFVCSDIFVVSFDEGDEVCGDVCCENAEVDGGHTRYCLEIILLCISRESTLVSMLKALLDMARGLGREIYENVVRLPPLDRSYAIQ